MSLIEISTQTIPLNTGELAPLAPSVSLHNLEACAPEIVRWTAQDRDGHVAYPFSNDEDTAPMFDHVLARQFTPEYRRATNRVALFVGEGSLAACIDKIPEDTILLVDSADSMVGFMEQYVHMLRTAPSPAAFLKTMTNHSKIDWYGTSKLAQQIANWEMSGYTHAMHNEAAFARAQAAANKKAIIPWRADVKDGEDMDYLATVLRGQEAHVTMMNLTNVIPFGTRARDPKPPLELDALPVTDTAPILTSYYDKYIDWMMPTGPFFGLSNLSPETAMQRNYYDFTERDKDLIRKTRQDHAAKIRIAVARANLIQRVFDR